MKSIKLNNVGPIQEANIKLGDLTVLVGPQASGKTILLQFIRFGFDKGFIKHTFVDNGYTWDRWEEFLSIYLGEGMDSVWNNNSRVTFDGKSFNTKSINSIRSSKRKGYFIPAHRSAVFDNGWPRAFGQFDTSMPFAIRDFSNHIRTSMVTLKGKNAKIFPKDNLLKKKIRDKIGESIYRGAELSLKVIGNSKKLILKTPDTKEGGISVGSWSTGQREFTPLLLGIYDLLPPARIKRKGDIETIILEEPEMGLHPTAIYTIMLIALELIGRNYQVVISTHSPAVLDIMWAIYEIKTKKAHPHKILELFDLKKEQTVKQLSESCINKKYKVYYFDSSNKDGVITKDISSLDPGEEHDIYTSGWGGLTHFSGKTAEVVGSLYEE